MTFNEYIKTARITDNPSGDFIYDARRDSGFPEIRCPEDLTRYMREIGADEDVRVAARESWNRYYQCEYKRKHRSS